MRCDIFVAIISVILVSNSIAGPLHCLQGSCVGKDVCADPKRDACREESKSCVYEHCEGLFTIHRCSTDVIEADVCTSEKKNCIKCKCNSKDYCNEVQKQPITSPPPPPPPPTPPPTQGPLQCFNGMCNNKDDCESKSEACTIEKGSCYAQTCTVGEAFAMTRKCQTNEIEADTCSQLNDGCTECTCNSKDFCNGYQPMPVEPIKPIKCYECESKDGGNCKTGECSTMESCQTTICADNKTITKSCAGGVVTDDTCAETGNCATCKCRSKDFCNDFLPEKAQTPPTPPTSPPTRATSSPTPPPQPPSSVALTCYKCTSFDGENCKTGQCSYGNNTATMCQIHVCHNDVFKSCQYAKSTTDGCTYDKTCTLCTCRNKDFCNDFLPKRVTFPPPAPPPPPPPPPAGETTYDCYYCTSEDGDDCKDRGHFGLGAGCSACSFWYNEETRMVSKSCLKGPHEVGCRLINPTTQECKCKANLCNVDPDGKWRVIEKHTTHGKVRIIDTQPPDGGQPESCVVNMLGVVFGAVAYWLAACNE